jgi:ribonuclease E
LIRSKESLGLTVLRRIQAAAVKGYLLAAKAKVPLDAANYLLNEKRDRLLKLEQEYGIRIHVEGDATLTGSLFNLTLEKKDITALEEEALEAAAAAFDDTEVAAVEPLEADVALEDMPLEDMPVEVEAAPRELVAELAPDLAETVAALAEAALSIEPNGASAVVEPVTVGSGSTLTREALTPPWQPTRRRLRFWWLRRLMSSSSQSLSEPLRHGPVDDSAAHSEDHASAHVTPSVSPQAHRSEEAPSRLPDAEAPWRRMLPPIKPPLLLPRPGADDTSPGDHLAV